MDPQDQAHPGENAQPVEEEEFVEDEDPEEDEIDPDEEQTIQISPWSSETKDHPSPFTLSTTTVCIIAQLLLILANLETQHQLFARYHVWAYLRDVLLGVWVTLFASICSTSLYEGILNDGEGIFQIAWHVASAGPQILIRRVAARLGRINARIAWSDDPERAAELLGNGDGGWYVASTLGNALAGLWGVVVNLAVLFWWDTIPSVVIGFSLALVQRYVWEARPLYKLIEFINIGGLWLDLAVDRDGPWEPWQRLIGRAASQLVLSAALLQGMFLWRFYAAEAVEIYKDREMLDSTRPVATWLRTTAVHLVAYTGYQVVLAVIPARVWHVSLGRMVKEEFLQSVRRGSFKDACLAPGSTPWANFRGVRCLQDLGWLVILALTTLVVHMALRYIVKKLARVGWWLCEPLFVWRTLWIAPTIARTRPQFLEQMEADFSLDENLQWRVLMTFLAPRSGSLPMMVPGGYNAEGVW